MAPRVLLFQWMGDYREAYQRLAGGGPETYNAQRFSVRSAGELAQEFGQYGVLCIAGAPPHDEVLPNGVRSLAAGLDPARPDFAAVTRLVERFRPTHVVAATPQVELLEWVLGQGIDLLPLFADSFSPGGAGLSWPRQLVRRWRHARFTRRLGRVLADRRVRWMSNHNVNASRALVRLGAPEGRVVPWDWPLPLPPDSFPPKHRDPAGSSWGLLYVGSVERAKGVGDAIGAVAELRRRGRPARLRVIGGGDPAPFRKEAAAAGAADAVRFDGRRPHAQVLAAMREADVVLVPSWHDYPEGVPNVIYESLAVRTPRVCSDHPAFRGLVGEGEATLSVPQRRPAALADAVEKLLTDPALYRRLSENAAGVLARLACPVTCYEMIRRWVAARPEDDRWLAGHSLAAGRCAAGCL
jgi:glycosyltransferase involved in cell wall biosynthesis